MPQMMQHTTASTTPCKPTKAITKDIGFVAPSVAARL